MAQPVETDYRHTHKHLGLITGELGQTDKQTHGRYQTYYLPCSAVDNCIHLPVLQIPIARLPEATRFRTGLPTLRDR